MRTKTVRQLWGQDFEIVREGLEESQVEAFVAQLVGERDMLMQRQEHLISLTKLAERTIAEADKLATDVKGEAEEEARTKATAILAKAEQEAQKIMEQKRAEILAAANKEAAVIIANAQQEIDLAVKQHKERVQQEIKEMAQKLHIQLVSGLKEVMEQAITLQAEWESKLSELVIDRPLPDDDAPSASVPVSLEQKEEIAPVTAPEADLENGSDVLEQLAKAWVDTDTAVCSKEQSPATPSQISHQPDAKDIKQVATALDEEGVTPAYQGTIELDITPPTTPGQLVEIQSYLRRWPGISICELRPSDHGYSIMLILNKPTHLIDILRQWPGIEHVRECAADETETLAHADSGKDGLKRIALTISTKT